MRKSEVYNTNKSSLILNIVEDASRIAINLVMIINLSVSEVYVCVKWLKGLSLTCITD